MAEGITLWIDDEIVVPPVAPPIGPPEFVAEEYWRHLVDGLRPGWRSWAVTWGPRSGRGQVRHADPR